MLDPYKGHTFGKLEAIPNIEHWTIIQQEYYYADSGYKEDSRQESLKLELRCFTDKKEFLLYIKQLADAGKLHQCRFHHVVPLKVETKLEVTVD